MPSRPKSKPHAHRQPESGSQGNGPEGQSKASVKDPGSDQIMRMPMTKYVSVVGMYTSLLAFSALFLPQSTVLQELALFFEDEPAAPSTPLEALTARPALTLSSLCLGAFLLQTWWSNWLRCWWIDAILQGTEEDKRKEKSFFTRRRLLAIARVYGALIIASFSIHAILILFGAPITELVLKTYFLALLIAILTVLPPAYLFDPPSLGNDSSSLVKRWTWVRLFAERFFRNPIERAIVYPAFGTLVGSWVGIIPIALDWERPWQAWPLTPAYGAIIGYILASIAALTANAMELVNTANLSTTGTPD